MLVGGPLKTRQMGEPLSNQVVCEREQRGEKSGGQTGLVWLTGDWEHQERHACLQEVNRE